MSYARGSVELGEFHGNPLDQPLLAHGDPDLDDLELGLPNSGLAKQLAKQKKPGAELEIVIDKVNDIAEAIPQPSAAPKKSYCTLRQFLILTAAGLTPLSFAFNAFISWTKMDIEKFNWKEFFETAKGYQVLAWISLLSSWSINAVSNAETIPKAFECVAHIRKHFWENPLRNSAIVALGTGAAIAAGSIGAASVAAAGGVASVVNGGANTFLFFVTRFYGLVNLSKRFNKWWTQGNLEDLVSRLTSDDAAIRTLAEVTLRDIADAHSQDLNDLLQKEKAGAAIDPKFTYDFLKIILKSGVHVKDKKWYEHIPSILNWTFAVLCAAAVAPTFGQKFLDGFSKFISFFSSSAANQIIFGDLLAKRIAGLTCGIATPLMYLSTCSQLFSTLADSWKTLRNPETPTWLKVAAPFLFTANLFASVSGWNITKGAIENENFIFAGIPEPKTLAATFCEGASAVATGAVNLKFVAIKISPPLEHKLAPDSKEAEESPEAATQSRTKHLKHVIKKVERWMQANALENEAAKSLNQIQDTPNRGFVLVDNGPRTPPPTPTGSRRPGVADASVQFSSGHDIENPLDEIVIENDNYVPGFGSENELRKQQRERELAQSGGSLAISGGTPKIFPGTVFGASAPLSARSSMPRIQSAPALSRP